MGNIERYEVRRWADGWSVHDTIGAAGIRIATCARQERAEKVARALNQHEGAVDLLERIDAAFEEHIEHEPPMWLLDIALEVEAWGRQHRAGWQ